MPKEHKPADKPQDSKPGFLKFWTDHHLLVEQRTSALLRARKSRNCGTIKFTYPGNLTQDTQENAHKKWETFPRKGDAAREIKWLLAIQTNLFVTRCRWNKNSRAAWDLVVARYRPASTNGERPNSILERIARSKATSEWEDLIQDTFAKAQRYVPIFLDLGNEEAELKWLCRIMTTQFLDERRKNTKAGPMDSLEDRAESGQLPVAMGDSIADLITTLGYEGIMEDLHKHPDAYGLHERDVDIYEERQNGLTLAEIALRRGSNISAVKRSEERVKKVLEARFTRDWLGNDQIQGEKPDAEQQ